MSEGILVLSPVALIYIKSFLLLKTNMSDLNIPFEIILLFSAFKTTIDHDVAGWWSFGEPSSNSCFFGKYFHKTFVMFFKNVVIFIFCTLKNIMPPHPDQISLK